MILELLLILLLIWFFASWSRNSFGISSKHRKIARKIQELTFFAEKVGQTAGLPKPSWHLRPSERGTWTQNQRIVYIQCWNPRSNDLYDDSTLRYAVLHELAHIFCPGHTHEFDRLESRLFSTAEKLGAFRSSDLIDPSYPCSFH